MALPATDAFTGTDGTSLPTYSSNWTNHTLGMEIQSNRANGLNGGYQSNSAWWNADTFASAHYSKGTYAGTATLGQAPSICVRAQSGAQSFYYAFCDNTTCYAGECIAGTGTDWDSGQSVSINNTVELRIDATTTTTVYLYIAGSLIATFTNKNALSDGAAGVAMFNDSNVVGIDNWEGGNTAGTPAPPKGKSVYTQAVRRAAFY